MRCQAKLFRFVLPMLLTGCAPAAGTVYFSAPARTPCSSARSEVRASLSRIETPTADAARLRQHVLAVSRMLQDCDAEARSVARASVEDWRTQSYVVRSDVRDLTRVSYASLPRVIPTYRRRLERLLAMYDALFDATRYASR